MVYELLFDLGNNCEYSIMRAEGCIEREIKNSLIYFNILYTNRKYMKYFISNNNKKRFFFLFSYLSSLFCKYNFVKILIKLVIDTRRT